ncbi:hypothetical protein [Anaeromyxobacter paludicola]|uniref:Lipoprotein n=1 Tax=Anaeromyxobacter paludicola TaxID=2918171 RepID=A0ABM7XBU1_9BACT|nr:hypothetical protein [Anaeromyxobacter paludicola]BDG09291.1 hypothetical protein AMPC_24040 [Anaeromyxobacter paludicola]
MTRALPLALVAAALTLAGCGPDCARYCAKVASCEAARAAAGQTSIFENWDQADPAKAEAACNSACDVTGGEKSHTIDCVLGHDCAAIAGGACEVTGTAAP